MRDVKVEYSDSAAVSETFADHCERVLFDGATLRVELAVTRVLEASADGKAVKARRVTASRLVLTPQATLELFSQLERVVGALAERGVLRKRGKEASIGQ